MSDVPPYWTDPGIGKFEVSIESVKKLDDRYHVYIKENVIRPAGGGQAGERGRLNVGDQNITIHDVISDADDVVLVTDGELTVGVKGQLEIDMDWRSSMMKNHTAEHLFVSIIKTKKEGITIGELWIDGKHGSVELLGPTLNYDIIFEAELEVTKIIEQDLPVSSEFVESSSIEPSVRSREGLTEKHDQLRVVRVGELDSSACSGIHVEQTGEIGFFKVLDVKMSKSSTRVEFAAGTNAANHTSTVYNMALRRKHSYPFEMEQLGAVLDKAKLAVVDKERLIEKTSHLLASGSTVEQVGECIFRYEYLPGYDASSLRNLSNQLSIAGSTVVLLFSPGTKSQVILRVNEMPQDASEYISKPVMQLGGRGGGKGEVFTGGFTDVEDSVKLYEGLVGKVRKSIIKS
jgi:alanyl-tRNA synthetase